jgi:hypothetical protein
MKNITCLVLPLCCILSQQKILMHKLNKARKFIVAAAVSSLRTRETQLLNNKIVLAFIYFHSMNRDLRR